MATKRKWWESSAPETPYWDESTSDTSQTPYWEDPYQQAPEPDYSDFLSWPEGSYSLKRKEQDYDIPQDFPYEKEDVVDETTGQSPFFPEKDRVYNPVGGWETSKLNDPSHSSAKYDYMRMVQALGGEYGQLRGNLDSLAEALRAQYPNIQVVGDDKIDFGDGYGPIDVITGGGDPTWLNANQAGRGGGGGGGGVGGGFGGGGGGGGALFPNTGQLQAALTGLFPGGAFNKDIVNQRSEIARENLQTHAASRTASNRAQLAERGLLGSGPEATAQNEMEQDIANQYGRAVSGIWADESQAADSRMVQALQMATGLAEADARNVIDRFRATTERDLGFGGLDLQRTLGLGNLALGNMEAENAYNLGLGRLGLDRDMGMYNIEQGDIDRLIALIEQMYKGAGGAAGGYY